MTNLLYLCKRTAPGHGRESSLINEC
jgi:hypothetical protein